MAIANHPQHYSRRKLAACAIAAAFLTISTACSDSSNSSVPAFKKRELERAIFFLDGNLESLQDSGFVKWTPTTAAAQLAETMNAAQTLSPEQEEEYKQVGGIKPLKPIPYVVGKPTGAWQIVLVPDEQKQLIRVEGYAKDLTQPLVVKEIPCCSP